MQKMREVLEGVFNRKANRMLRFIIVHNEVGQSEKRFFTKDIDVPELEQSLKYTGFSTLAPVQRRLLGVEVLDPKRQA